MSEMERRGAYEGQCARKDGVNDKKRCPRSTESHGTNSKKRGMKTWREKGFDASEVLKASHQTKGKD